MAIITGSNIALAPLTTFGVGGGARFYHRVESAAALIAAVKAAEAAGQKYCILAGGSNVVFDDEEFPGVVIHYRLKPQAQHFNLKDDELIVEAGVPLAALINFSLKHNLAGLEALSGIPGTVGGALVGNAGAYGQSISDCLVAVQVWDGQQIKWLSKKACRFIYRDSLFKHSDRLVLAAKFKLPAGEGKALAKKSREIIKIRNAKYKPGLKCPGSFFKNVLVKDISKTALAKIDQSKIRDGKIAAGYLLEEVGAKGLKLGQLKVADFHGNLIINEGGATAAEVKKLAALLKKRVWQKFGINLEEEVRFL